MGIFSFLRKRNSSPLNTEGSSGSAGNAHLTQDQLIYELLRERRRDRRSSLIKTSFIALAGLAYFAWMGLMLSPGLSSGPPKEPFAAVVRIQGMIADGKPASYEKLASVLRQAFTHPNSKGVVLQINSPGGTPVQSALIHDLIVELKTGTGKPVIAVGEDMMTSGAYMIAVAADTLVANRSSVVGSIGVISSGFGFSELIDRVGIERRVFTAGESKSLLDPFRPAQPEDAARQQKLLEEIHDHFITLVKEGRSDRLDLETEGLFEGAVWTGGQALEVGLIDEIGRVDTAIKKHLKVAKAYPFEIRRSLMSSIMNDLSVKVSEKLIKVLSREAPVMTEYTF